MRKLLILLAVSTIGFTSCSKSTSENGPYTCYCTYGLTTGSYFRDTATTITYASYVNLTEARNYCAQREDTLTSIGYIQNSNCFVK